MLISQLVVKEAKGLIKRTSSVDVQRTAHKGNANSFLWGQGNTVASVLEDVTPVDKIHSSLTVNKKLSHYWRAIKQQFETVRFTAFNSFEFV